MKIIDLLNKIADVEEVPKKIKYDDKEFKFIEGAYEDEKGNDLCHYNYSCMTFLNNEIEIIEEKKIPEKLDDFDLTTYSRDDEDLGLELNYTGVSNTFNDVYFKINEIIDYLKSKGE